MVQMKWVIVTQVVYDQDWKKWKYIPVSWLQFLYIIIKFLLTIEHAPTRDVTQYALNHPEKLGGGGESLKACKFAGQCPKTGWK